jgi:site-specific recombinase XerD
MSDQLRPMNEASKRANTKPPVNFHCLRHTYASHAVMNGTPLMVVARNLGHADTRIVWLVVVNRLETFRTAQITSTWTIFGE